MPESNDRSKTVVAVGDGRIELSRVGEYVVLRNPDRPWEERLTLDSAWALAEALDDLATAASEENTRLDA